MVLPLVRAHDVSMAKKVVTNFKPPRRHYFFREWRKFRGFTQEELAEVVGLSPPSISQLEKGKQGFTDSTLEALASALSCNPGDLLMRNPLDEDAPWTIWDNIPKQDRPRAVQILKAFVKTGTNG